MVRAGALSYVIVISLIIGSILISLISLSYLNRKAFVDLQFKQNVIANANSGFTILLANPKISSSEIDLFAEEKDSVTLKTFPWGILEIGVAIAHHKKHLFTKIGLMGYPPDKDKEMALYLADLNRPLSLAGTTKIVGDAYLPEAGVKRAYIERQNYVGKKLIYGKQQRSSRKLPLLNTLYVERVNAMFNYSEEFEEQKDSLSNSFLKPTLHMFTNGRLDGVYQGNIIIHSQNTIEISKNCVLNDVQVYAPQIIIEKGFEGNAQFFAKENIYIQRDVQLNYPSVLALFTNNKDDRAELDIKIEEDSYINGIVLVDTRGNIRNLSKLFLEKDATIHGEVYVNGLSEIHGTIHGSILTNKFYLKTPSSIYENHILNVEIDVFKRNDAFVGSNIVEKPLSRKVIKWVN